MPRTNRHNALTHIRHIRENVLGPHRTRQQIGEDLGLRGVSTRNVPAEIAALGTGREVAVLPIAVHTKRAEGIAVQAASTQNPGVAAEAALKYATGSPTDNGWEDTPPLSDHERRKAYLAEIADNAADRRDNRHA